MRPHFKNPIMQRMYEDCLVSAVDQNSLFWHHGRPNRLGVVSSAFWSGYDGEPTKWKRTSLAHAAWTAGRIFERAGRGSA